METKLNELIKERSITDELKIVLKSCWFIRTDVKRCLLYEINFDSSEIGSHSKIHPIKAVLISLFNGLNTYRDIINEIINLFDCTIEQAEKSVYATLEEFRDNFELWGNGIKIREFDIREFKVIDGKIDLKTSKLYKPIMMILHIADSCIRDCLYCNVQKRNTPRKSALTTLEILNLIQEAADYGIKTLSIAGGDPFVRNDIPQLIEKALQCKLYFYISTKAYISTKVAKELKKTGLKQIQISIDGPNSEINDFLTHSKNSFVETVESIKNLRREGLIIKTNSIITPYNIESVPQLIELLVSLGVSKISISPYAASLHAGEWRDKLFISLKAGRKLKDVVDFYRKKFPDTYIKYEQALDYLYSSPKSRETRYKERAYCSAGKTGFLIHEDGVMTLCEECPVIDELIIGNIRTNTLEELWNSPRIKEITYPDKEKYNGTECYTCDEYDECHSFKGRCWRESLKAFDKLYAPPPLCPKAPAGRRIF
jgi:radical SAM protein with 4Fe4S-binding SPASM domain